MNNIENTSPKFSIITVCLNDPNLEQTCESIVNQSFQDFEWIVIDGGSDRQTQDIFEKYKYRMNYFVSEKDNGIYDAMNKGIIQAHGEWFNFMNAGDRFYDSDILKFVVGKINEVKMDDKPDIFYGDDISKKENGIFVSDLPCCIDKYFMYKATLRHQASFIVASSFKRIGIYDSSLRVCSDYKWFLCALKHGLEFRKITGCPLAIMDGNGIGSQMTHIHLEERKCVQRDFFSSDELPAFAVRLSKEKRLIAINFIASKRAENKNH
ncbi:MAG: glycosyltransferase [Spirochaetaceae bacterium]|nr:glycosyltransferase [Spirochaetaceae bacterium]